MNNYLCKKCNEKWPCKTLKKLWKIENKVTDTQLSMNLKTTMNTD
jgi:hypothetical protein